MELENKDILERSVSEKMCSSGSNGVGEICSPGTADTCGDLCVATKTNYVEILNFRHFFKHIVFTSEGDKIRNKEIKNYINVSVVVDIECGNTNN